METLEFCFLFFLFFFAVPSTDYKIVSEKNSYFTTTLLQSKLPPDKLS